MAAGLFGTDGVRGLVNVYPMTPEAVLRFGMAAGVYFSAGVHRSKVLIAKDTRLSGYLVESALMSGLLSVGVDVILLGPMPTPALAMLIKSLRADFGIMISASHNPYYDNGLKLFDSRGAKLSDQSENKVQNLFLDTDLTKYLAQPDKLGRAKRLDDAIGRYIEFVKGSFLKHKNLGGMRIVVDCANGSAYKIAPTIFWELGAEVIALGCEPNGFNINDNCGSMNPSLLCQKVLETRADIGIALDGDADRVVVCDEKGNIVSGDHMISAIALHMLEEKSLKSGVVVTHISNGAIDEFLQQHSIPVYRSNIGDRNVAINMKKHHCNLGGEQSGHIIISNYSSSGDGIVASLQLLGMLVKSGNKASIINQMFTLNPQIMRSFRFDSKNPLDTDETVASIEKIKKENGELKIIVRKSGTENMVRVVVEGHDKDHVERIATQIEAVLAG